MTEYTPAQKLMLAIEEVRTKIGRTNEDVGEGWTLVNIYPNAHIFVKELEDGFLTVIREKRIGRDDPKIFPEGRLHISFSHNRKDKKPDGTNVPGRYPTWDESKEIRYKFGPADINMAIMFPPMDDYVNFHPTCLHLLEIPKDLALKPNPLTGTI